MTGTSNSKETSAVVGELPILEGLEHCHIFGDYGWMGVYVASFKWRREVLHFLATRRWRNIIALQHNPAIVTPVRGRVICAGGVTIADGKETPTFSIYAVEGVRKSGWRLIGFNKQLSVDIDAVRAETAFHESATDRYVSEYDKLPRPPLGHVV